MWSDSMVLGEAQSLCSDERNAVRAAIQRGRRVVLRTMLNQLFIKRLASDSSK